MWVNRYHWVARMGGFEARLETRAQYAWLWREWTLLFPKLEAACIMPNHLHALEPTDSSQLSSTRIRIERMLRRMQNTSGPSWEWQTVPEPSLVRDREKWLRDLRYIHLNPCRDRLVSDPLEWPWSTHRDWVGLAPDPESLSARTKGLLPWKSVDWRTQFHRWVSADTSTGTPQGTVLPSTQARPTPSPWELVLPAQPKNSSPLLESTPETLVRAWCALHRMPAIAPSPGADRAQCIREILSVSPLRPYQMARFFGVGRQYVARVHREGLSSALQTEKQRQRLALLLRSFISDPRLRN
jgi:REP element-mobilizing transposase RayT